jgi:hypothetical protein
MVQLLAFGFCIASCLVLVALLSMQRERNADVADNCKVGSISLCESLVSFLTTSCAAGPCYLNVSIVDDDAPPIGVGVEHPTGDRTGRYHR